MEPERRTGGARARRPADVLLLVLNVAIVVVGLAVVWVKWREHAGIARSETPVLDTGGAPLPLRTGVRGVVPEPEPDGGAESSPAAGAERGGTGHAAGTGTASGAGATVVVGTGGETGTGRGSVPAAGAGAAGREPPAGKQAREPSAAVPPPLRIRGREDDSLPPATVPAVPRDRPPEPVRALASTEAAIDRVGVDLEVLRAIRGAYPSSAADYGSNRGIEALHVALAKVGKTGGLRLGDTDDDGRVEILDAWGRPLVYTSPDDYASAQRWAPGDTDAVDLAACRERASGAFAAAGAFQLWSAGPDGRPEAGRGDDVTSWVSRD